MKIKKEFDLIKSDNIVSINKRDIMSHSINSNDLKIIVDKYNKEVLKIKNPMLSLINKIMEDKVIPNFSRGLYTFDNISFVNLDNHNLPTYYNNIEKNIICNFVKPIHYLSLNDIVAHIIYAYSYKSIIKLKMYNRNMLKYLGNLYTNIILSTFGRKEGLLSNLKNLGLMTLITFQFIDYHYFKKKEDLSSYIKFIDNKYIKNELDLSEIKYYKKYVNIETFKQFIETLNKVDLIQRIDYKSFISILYNRYQRNENIVGLFDTFERTVPFVLTLNFSNIINSGFGMIFKDNDKKIYNLTRYGISLLAMYL